MNRAIKLIKYFSVLFFIGLLFSCSDGLFSGAGIKIKLPDSSRASVGDISLYDITCHGNSENYKATGHPGETVVINDMVPGKYTVTVDALTVSNEKILVGSAETYVVSGQTASVMIKMKYAPGQTVTITFDSNGGSGSLDSQTVKVGESVELSANTFTKQEGSSNLTFIGWALSPSSTTVVYNDKQIISPDTNLTLYAVWTNDAVQYTVEHYRENLEGGYEIVNNDTQILQGQKGTNTLAVAKQYKGFTAQNFEQVTLGENGNTVQIYYKRNSYKLKFYVDEKAYGNEQTLKYGQTITLPTTPTIDGYNFEGWYTDSEYKTKFAATNSIIEADTTIYGKFVELPSVGKPVITVTDTGVTISCTTVGATIYYLVSDTASPSSTNITNVYNNEITNVANKYVAAIAKKDGMRQSEISVQKIEQVEKPTIKNQEGGAITITCSTSGAEIYYTLDSGTEQNYNTPFTPEKSCEVTAYAKKSGMLKSASANIQYKKTAVTGLGDKSGDAEYSVGDIVFDDGTWTSNITSLTEEQKIHAQAVIFYDGKDPKESGTVYQGIYDVLGNKVLGVNIDLPTEKKVWAVDSADGYDKDLTDISCAVSTEMPSSEMFYNIANGNRNYLTGDMDGSDNLSSLKNAVNDESADNYPAIFWASEKGAGYYLPSAMEMIALAERNTDVNKSLTSLGKSNIQNGTYWSSNQLEDGYTVIYAAGVLISGNVDEYLEKGDSAYVCAIKKFK